MSKSDESDYSRINLSDTADLIRLKFQKAKSDSFEGIKIDKDARPEATNLLTIYAALSDISLEQAESKFQNKQFSEFKKELAELAVEKLAPISQEFNKLLEDKSYLKNILNSGSEKAFEIAENNLKQIKEIVGFFS
jgi:tryptophanyl-tRNA synthetase